MIQHDEEDALACKVKNNLEGIERVYRYISAVPGYSRYSGRYLIRADPFGVGCQVSASEREGTGQPAVHARLTIHSHWEANVTSHLTA